tara:strand:- start:1374 stop:2138 length:765 start_codon:yes stop_codon:yes gene_type:complete
MLYSQEFGNGKSIVILHGFLGSSDNWRQITKTFFNDHNVHLLDLRNHGNSFQSPISNYKCMSNDVIEYISEKKLKNIILIGHSMGGKVAIETASKIKSISHLIIVDIVPKKYKADHHDVLNALKNSNFNSLKTITQCDVELSKYVEEKSIRQFLIKNIKRNKNNEFKWKINTNYIIDNYDNILEAPNIKDAITIPTLFIKGENSTYINKDDLETINKLFKNARIKTIQNSGHWIQAEKPIEFSAITKEFISNDN